MNKNPMSGGRRFALASLSAFATAWSVTPVGFILALLPMVKLSDPASSSDPWAGFGLVLVAGFIGLVLGAIAATAVFVKVFTMDNSLASESVVTAVPTPLPAWLSEVAPAKV